MNQPIKDEDIKVGDVLVAKYPGTHGTEFKIICVRKTKTQIVTQLFSRRDVAYRFRRDTLTRCGREEGRFSWLHVPTIIGKVEVNGNTDRQEKTTE